MIRFARVMVDLLVAAAATLAGVGWLYLVRHIMVLAFGQSFPEALPLQRLAGGMGQPAARLVVSWLPVGVVMGTLRMGRPRWWRAVVSFTVATVLLLAIGAASDAVTANETFRSHVSEQPGREVIWVSAALMALGAIMPGGSAPARRAIRQGSRRPAPARPAAR